MALYPASDDSGSVNDSENVKRIKFTFEDWGWVVICLGMGVGAGIAFLPVEVGMKGLWIFLAAAIIGYPGMYLFQRLFVNTLCAADSSKDYADIISEYLGARWGTFIGVLYFVMMVIWFFVYTETVIKDSASYLVSFGVLKTNLSGNPIYILVVLSVLVMVASKGERLLFKLSSVLALTVLSILLLLGLSMIPHWELENVSSLPSPGSLAKNGLVTLPFVLTSILFIQSLSPMVIFFRRESSDARVARYRSLRAMNIAFLTLFFIVFFYALSFKLSITQQEAVKAYDENVSALAIAASHNSSLCSTVLEVMLDILAVLACFLSVFLGLKEASKGLVVKILNRIYGEGNVNEKGLSWKIAIFLILLGVCMTLINPPILWYTLICSPIFGLIGCLIPAYLTLRTPRLRKYRGIHLWLVVAMGIMLCLAPFMALFCGLK